MSILIKGMEMPVERQSFTITIQYNGLVLDSETEIQIGEAYELPPHGDLIDRNALYEDWLTYGENARIYDTNDFLESLSNTPVIIPAERGEE